LFVQLGLTRRSWLCTVCHPQFGGINYHPNKWWKIFLYAERGSGKARRLLQDFCTNVPGLLNSFLPWKRFLQCEIWRRCGMFLPVVSANRIETTTRHELTCRAPPFGKPPIPSWWKSANLGESLTYLSHFVLAISSFSKLHISAIVEWIFSSMLRIGWYWWWLFFFENPRLPKAHSRDILSRSAEFDIRWHVVNSWFVLRIGGVLEKRERGFIVDSLSLSRIRNHNIDHSLSLFAAQSQ
jgi:hypothetical protein